MSFKCKHGNLVMHTAVSYGQQWTYHSEHPMAEMLAPEYFATAQGIRSGDEMRIVQTETVDSKSPVVCIARVEVIAKDGKDIEFSLPSKPVSFKRKLDKAA